jgi:hypothetical protein
MLLLIGVAMQFNKLRLISFLLGAISTGAIGQELSSYASVCKNEKGGDKITNYVNGGIGVTVQGSTSCGCRISESGKPTIQWNILGNKASIAEIQGIKIWANQDVDGFPVPEPEIDSLEKLVYNSLPKFGGCPSQDAYNTIYAAAIAYKNNRMRERQAEKDVNKKYMDNLASRTKYFCKGIPKMRRSLSEQMANELRVNPDTITVNRVEVRSANDCKAVFYSPVGAFKCSIDFDNSGIINSFTDCRK